jgi:hypothetical protein
MKEGVLHAAIGHKIIWSERSHVEKNTYWMVSFIHIPETGKTKLH